MYKRRARGRKSETADCLLFVIDCIFTVYEELKCRKSHLVFVFFMLNNYKPEFRAEVYYYPSVLAV